MLTVIVFGFKSMEFSTGACTTLRMLHLPLPLINRLLKQSSIFMFQKKDFRFLTLIRLASFVWDKGYAALNLGLICLLA